MSSHTMPLAAGVAPSGLLPTYPPPLGAQIRNQVYGRSEELVHLTLMLFQVNVVRGGVWAYEGRAEECITGRCM